MSYEYKNMSEDKHENTSKGVPTNPSCNASAIICIYPYTPPQWFLAKYNDSSKRAIETTGD
jgi:hypothetical protein